MTKAELMDCCGCSAWAAAMWARQPFEDAAAMHRAADEIWWALRVEDWLEAFSKHPQIGQKSGAKWSAQEQSGMNSAGETIAREMTRLNREYESRFGFIFIVCATRRSAEEMLALLRERIGHARDEEIRIAADEQAKITHLRLDKLVRE